MKRLTIALAVGAMMLLCCNGDIFHKLDLIYNAASPIMFTELENYFVRNDVDCSKQQRLILDNKTDFEQFFGMGAFMGGMPTEVNWNKQYVVALVLPETNRETIITPIDVRQVSNKVVLCYKVQRSKEKMSYTMIPFTAVAIDKPASSQEMQIYFLEK